MSTPLLASMNKLSPDELRNLYPQRPSTTYYRTKVIPKDSDVYKLLYTHFPIFDEWRIKDDLEDIDKSGGNGVVYSMAAKLLTSDMAPFLLSGAPEFYGLSELLNQLSNSREVNDIFENHTFSLHLPDDLHEAAIVEYRKAFKKVFLDTYYSSPYFRGFFDELKKLMNQKVDLSGKRVDQITPADPWVIARFAEATALRRVPDYRLDPEAYRSEFSGAFARAEIFWREQLEEDLKRRFVGTPTLTQLSTADLQHLSEYLLQHYIQSYTTAKSDVWVYSFTETDSPEDQLFNRAKLEPYKRIGELRDLSKAQIGYGRDHDFFKKNKDWIASFSYAKKAGGWYGGFNHEAYRTIKHPDLDENRIYFIATSDGLLDFSTAINGELSDFFENKIQSDRRWNSEVQGQIAVQVHQSLSAILSALSLDLSLVPILDRLISNLNQPEKLADIVLDIYLLQSSNVYRSYSSKLNSKISGPAFFIKFVAETLWGKDYIKSRDNKAKLSGKPHILKFITSRYYRIYKGDSGKTNGSNELTSSTENSTGSQHKIIDLNHRPKPGSKHNSAEETNLFRILKSTIPRPNRLDYKVDFDENAWENWITGDSSFNYSQDFFQIQSEVSMQIVDGVTPIPIPRDFILTQIEVSDAETKNKLILGHDYSIKTSEDGRFAWIQMIKKPLSFITQFLPQNLFGTQIKALTIQAGYNPHKPLELSSSNNINNDYVIPNEKIIKVIPLLEQAGFTFFSKSIKTQLRNQSPITIKTLVRLFNITSKYEKNWQSAPAEESSHQGNPFIRFAPMLIKGQFCGLCYTANEFGEELLNFLFSNNPDVKFELLMTYFIDDRETFITSPGHAEVRMKRKNKTVLIVDFTPTGDELNLPDGISLEDHLSNETAKQAQINRETMIQKLKDLSTLLSNSDFMISVFSKNKPVRGMDTHPVVETFRLSLFLIELLESNHISAPIPNTLKHFFNQNDVFNIDGLKSGILRTYDLIDRLLYPTSNSNYVEGKRAESELATVKYLLNYLENNLNIFGSQKPEISQKYIDSGAKIGSCNGYLN